jgi:hypothetical protein
LPWPLSVPADNTIADVGATGVAATAVAEPPAAIIPRVSAAVIKDFFVVRTVRSFLCEKDVAKPPTGGRVLSAP